MGALERPSVERPSVERPSVERPSVERPSVERLSPAGPRGIRINQISLTWAAAVPIRERNGCGGGRHL